MGLGLLAGCGPILQHGVSLQDILAQDTTLNQGEYHLMPGDQLEVHHILDPDYSAVVLIAPDGKIVVPGLKGEIRAQGLTLDELTSQLNMLYRSQGVLNKPFFSLTLRSSANLEVFVSGEVQRPGYLDVGGGERHVMQVIASAGGFLPTARTNEVLIVRTPEPGKTEVFSVDLDRVIHGTDLSQNVRVRPLDVILVPRSDVASLDLWVDQYIRQALPIPISGSITYTNNPNSAFLK
jgi:protein involved in polysaccharide export with SLBB domain